MLRIFAVLVFILTSFPAFAAQKQIGADCSGDAGSVDWDAVSQCNGSKFVKGPLMLGAVATPQYSNATCDSSKAGMIQWTGTAFQGCDGMNWIVFSNASGGSSALGSTATAAAPARSGDGTTGLFSAAASTVSVATAGTERLRVTGTGSVGVGTVTPRETLEVNGGLLVTGTVTGATGWTPVSQDSYYMSGTCVIGTMRINGSFPCFCVGGSRWQCLTANF